MSATLDLPPPYRAIVLRERRDAFAHACSIADAEGAGSLVWVGRFDQLELAIVLEPEEPLATARRAIYAVMNAAGDALVAACPPEKPLAFAWPDTLLIEGGIVGGCRLAWPPDAAEDEPPRWLVAGVTIRLALPVIRAAAGAHPLDIAGTKGTSLEVEGFEVMDAIQIAESLARHLMVQIDRWGADGFDPVGRQFLARLQSGPDARATLDDDGNLTRGNLTTGDLPGLGCVRQALRSSLGTPRWLDPKTGDPWL